MMSMRSMLALCVVAVVAVAGEATAAAGAAAAAAAKTQYFSTILDDGSYRVTPLPSSPTNTPWGSDEVVRTEYTPSYHEDGWDRLNIATNPDVEDETAAFAAGFTEGKLTAGHIYNHAVNTGVYNTTLSSALQNFLDENTMFMAAQMKASTSLKPENPQAVYWRHVGIVIEQLNGIASGYSSTEQGQRRPLSALGFLRLNLDGDMEDLSTAVGDVHKTREELALSASHCSALIKLLPHNTDIFIAQDTWSSFNSMTRIMKRYDFPFSADRNGKSPVPGRAVAFSSYPGVLFSGDDFYELNSGLVVMETTIGNSNPELYKKYVRPNCVFEWLRNIVANRLAHDGPSWRKVYQQYNSGTYNNQNFVLNYNLFKPGKDLKPNTLLMVEQIPGTIVATDVSAKLQKDGYFGSYNVAYDPQVRQLSGVDDNEKLFGSWFSYNMTARARLFRRNHTHVVDMDSMQALMRYNNYKHDPLSSQLDTCHYRHMSNCTPSYTTENTIACRGDLNPKNGVYGLSAFGQRNHVATDAKISSFSTFNATALPIRAVCGPTSDQVPVFKFSTSPFKDTPHLGMPDEWTFDWVTVRWDTPLAP